MAALGGGCLLLPAGAPAQPVAAAGTISAAASWTPVSLNQGTLTMSWSGLSTQGVDDGFILVNDTGATTSSPGGAMLVTPCPRNLCNTPEGASFDFFRLVGLYGGSGTDTETMDVPDTGHLYVQFEAESYAGTACSPSCLSNVVEVDVTGKSSGGSGGGGGGGGSNTGAVQVAEGWATITTKGKT